MHHTPLISTIVAGLVLAFIFGAIANRLRFPPLVGYLLAGVLVGPYTPGFVADQALALELAEIGVILLMFGVGMHFSLKDLLSVKAIAIPGAVVQIAVATVMGLGLAKWMGWSYGAGFVFGLALSVASTVVLLRAMEERRLLDTTRGRIAVGWLIVEDLAMVLALVLLPTLAGLMGGEGEGGHSPTMKEIVATVCVTLGKVAAFIALMLVVGRRVIPWLLHVIARSGSRELFSLSVLAVGLGVAFGSATLFGVSFALGAFFAGMVLNESELSHRAAEESLPLRDAFAVLFFVSVGMLFDPTILLREPWQVLWTFLIIVVGKSVAAAAIVLAFGHPMRTALTISASLAQIGEFSFILAALGISLGLLPPEGRDLIITGAILSIFANPMCFSIGDRIGDRLKRRQPQPPPAEAPVEAAGASAALAVSEVPSPEATHTTLQGHAVVVGYGRVGSSIAGDLVGTGVPMLVIEERHQLAELARGQGIEVISGNGAKLALIKAANLEKARWLFIAIPNGFEAGQISEQARKLNPELKIIARAHSDAEVEHLRKHGADHIIMGEREIAMGMLDHARGRYDEGSGMVLPA
jgi:CPA2 family monovalent cation:H+ antiporter-2